MHNICCIGHITHDKVVTPGSVVHMPGGTSFYFSNAIRQMDTRYQLVTAVAAPELPYVTALRNAGIEITVFPSQQTVFFENIYSQDQDNRTQRVLHKSDPFTVDQLKEVKAEIFHLGPLLADDIPVSLIRDLASRGKVSLDVQGYLREVREENVYPVDWLDKKEALPFISILKANETEMEKLTGTSDIKEGIQKLTDWGVVEVIITLGSKGSVIYHEGETCIIPAYIPEQVIDATGCGDTYMAGYLYRRTKGDSINDAGNFAAAMATRKIEGSGPFEGTEKDVLDVLQQRATKLFSFQ